jgi:uracil-DNA glycosylase
MLSSSAMTRSFGSDPSTERLDPEKHQGSLSTEDLNATISGYRALDQRASGQYASFLRQATACRRCLDDPRIPANQRPLPFLCGTAPFDENGVEHLTRAAGSLQEYRRWGSATGSISYNPDDPAAPTALRQFLDGAGLTGLSVGQCGWSDMTMRLRGADMARGTRLMVLGNDWYPLTQCSRFLTDTYESDSALLTFLRLLSGIHRTPSAAEFRIFVQRERVYFGNTLLCYRTGWAKKGPENLLADSFRHCQEHLARHISAVAPEILVTFGQNSCAAVARIGMALDRDVQETLTGLREVDRQGGLIGIMDGHRARRGAAPLRLEIGDRELAFFPLCHPSMPNRYKGDYEALRTALSLAPAAS